MSKKRVKIGPSCLGTLEISKVASIWLKIPSLLFALVHVTSCTILHRVSHSHNTSKNINNDKSSITLLTVSENWIVCSYFNHESKRTELSTQTSHEGVIDEHVVTENK